MSSNVTCDVLDTLLVVISMSQVWGWVKGYRLVIKKETYPIWMWLRPMVTNRPNWVTVSWLSGLVVICAVSACFTSLV
jgi:hypothetical protein